jgi:hypothetical protein
MNFWNGANGSRHKSRSIAPPDLTFLLIREAGPDWRHEPPNFAAGTAAATNR